jgi:hypothetical protein
MAKTKAPKRLGVSLTPRRTWDAEFQVADQSWIVSIQVDDRPCTLIDPHGHPSEIFPMEGTYKLVFPSGSASPLQRLIIDPDPGTGRP